jgi:hypothetical protein
MLKLWNEIKALLAVKKEITTMNMSELKTSEGRLTLILNILNIYAAIHGIIPADLAAKIGVISVSVYGVLRSVVKAAENLVGLVPAAAPIVAEVSKDLDAVAPKVNP